MDSIRFEPSVSATFAIDRNATSGGGDLFADMLGDHLKKRAETDRPEPITRRHAKPDRPVDGDDRPAARRARIVIKHGHELRDVAQEARDVTPEATEQRRLAAPAEGSAACMDDQADEPQITTTQDKDQQTDQQEAGLVTTQPAADAPAEEAQVALVPTLTVEQAAPAEATDGAATIEPAAADAAADAAAQAADDAAKADLAAGIAATLGDTVVGLMAGDEAGTAASAQALAAADPAALVTPKVATPAAAETAQAAATDLAAKVTPEAPRPAVETKPRSTPRATPAAEIKAQATTTPAPHAATPIQPAAQAAAVAPLGETASDGFDAALSGDGTGAPGWGLHLAQGGASKRPDFIAQLRQHLQELPVHEQVAVNIQRAMRAGTNRMTIELSPSELGKIHVKLEIDEEKRVTAAVTVEKPSTLELLQRDGKALERALQDAGLKMEGNDLSFSLARQNGEGFAEDMQRSGPAGFGNGSDEAQADSELSAPPAAALVDTAAGLVNVQI